MLAETTQNNTQEEVDSGGADDTQTSGVELWPQQNVSKTSLEIEQLEQNKLKYTYHSIFAEWWKFLET